MDRRLSELLISLSFFPFFELEDFFLGWMVLIHSRGKLVNLGGLSTIYENKKFSWIILEL